MGLAQVGGGYQVGDGNGNEVTMYQRVVPPTITAAYTVTAADLAGGLISATSAG